MENSFTCTPDDLLKIIKGYASQGATDIELANLYEALSPSSSPPITPPEKNKDLKKILEIIHNRRQHNGSLAGDVRRFVEDTEGEFSLRQMFDSLCLVKREDKDAARHAIRRLAASGEIKSSGRGGRMEGRHDFWKAGGRMIRDIHYIFGKGAAIIAIKKKASPKKETNDYGRGPREPSEAQNTEQAGISSGRHIPAAGVKAGACEVR